MKPAFIPALAISALSVFTCSAQNYVTLFADCNYQGKSFYLEAGNYRGYQMKVDNDQLSRSTGDGCVRPAKERCIACPHIGFEINNDCVPFAALRFVASHGIAILDLQCIEVRVPANDFAKLR